MRRVAALLLAVGVGVGCVASPESGPEPACVIDDDCQGSEVCRDSLCFGDPPDLDLAVELIPPAGRVDLARTEIAALDVTSDGRVDLGFVRAVEVSGRVLLRTGGEAIPARLEFRRPSRVPGFPDSTVSVISTATDGFRVSLLPNLEGEVYELTVLPGDGNQLVALVDELPNALAPPLRTTMSVSRTRQQDLVLADPSMLKVIAGEVKDATQKPVAGLVVRALGRVHPGSPLALASSIALTGDDGKFFLLVPLAIEDTFDLEVSPRPGSWGPTLVRHGIVVADSGTVDPVRITLPTFASPGPFTVEVRGADPGGGDRPADGATLRFRCTVESLSGDDVVFHAETRVRADGFAEVQLLPGQADLNRIYTVDVIPVPGSSHAPLWGATVSVGPVVGVVLPRLELPQRTYVTGAVLDADGRPLAGVSVSARLSSRVEAMLSAEVRGRLAVLGSPLAETTSDGEGRFGLWLDSQLPGATPTYDVELTPPAGSNLPRWSRDGLVLDGSTEVTLGDLFLPEPSLASGTILDADNLPVPDAEVRVYVRARDSICEPIDTCEPPARLRGITRANDGGSVLLVLPDPTPPAVALP
jgi:hypothetical protein